jgi:predicted Zn-dependent protease
MLWIRAYQWIQSCPDHFHLIYSNPKEDAYVYRILESKNFVKAYQLAVAARRDVSHADWPAALAKFELSMKLEPGLVGVRNDAAATLVLSGGDLKKAERLLNEALRLDPDSALTRANLARVRKRLKERF